jgi:hypothetical protein
MKTHPKTVDFTHALKNGKLVHIDNVVNGKKSECFCPSCNEPLIAYNNPKNKKAHHFQHVNLKECKHYYETMIHYLAKEIINELGELTVPKHIFKLSDYARSYCEYEWDRFNPKEEITSFKIKFDKILVEKYDNGIKPDLICEVNGIQIHIEIAVTHFIDEKKEEKIIKNNAISLEIDLSSIEREINRDSLKNLLIDNIEHMKWHNNKSISNAKFAAEKNKILIKNFIYENSRVQKAYGKAKSIYKCPIINKKYDISLYNCESCRYLAQVMEEYEGTQEDYDNKRTIYPKVSVSCIGHVSVMFDKTLNQFGIKVGENKAFNGGVSVR